MLNGRKYLSWSIAVRIALEAKKKVDFIYGSIKPPQDPEDYREWKSVDSMIKSWITNSIQDEIAETFAFALTSKALWDVLEEHFGVSRMMPMPACTCGKCTCELNKNIADVMFSFNLLQFLMGLNPMYDVVRTQILNLDPLPSMNKAFHIVVTDKAQRNINLTYSGSAEESSAMMAKGYQPKNESSGLKKKEMSKKDKYCVSIEKRVGKKIMAAAVKDSNTAYTPIHQECDLNSRGDLTSAVSYLLKEFQRLGKGKPSNSKDEQEQKSNHLLAKGVAVESLYYLNKESSPSCNNSFLLEMQ
ncbi:uncharacterized protein G2W53_001447 [Senna tora]|uniref:Retrotransposon Copia-like N-terminal domain-containing protein n=1 Tax=Senna tora TaxID=362788 RepID=A0A834XGB1_9FABA|nr:uncharacterized protein G2W53_001447 [Senna tora]